MSYQDHSPHIILPGLVDAHVHLNEPGRTQWEGFYTGTQAASFGGVTTVIDMPLNAIPATTTVANLHKKIRAAQGKCWVDVGFYGGVIPANTGELKGLVKQGVRGFKGFLIESGVPEFPAVSMSDVKQVLNELKDEPTIVMFHAEMLPPVNKSHEEGPNTSLLLEPARHRNEYSAFLESRPPSLETYAIQEICSLAHLAPCLPLHIVHLSTVEAIPILEQARSQGVEITAETCPHYLSLAAEHIQKGDTRHKCCPPIRSQSNQDGLWMELERPGGVINTIVSDHSPCTPVLKDLPSSIPGHARDATRGDKDKGDFFSAWGGISSVGMGLPVIWTEMNRRGMTTSPTAILDVVQWCCTNTAAQVGLEYVKGDIDVGMDADFCIFDDVAEWIVEPSTMLFRNKCSPYQDKTMRGMVKETWLRGRQIFVRGDPDGGFVGKSCSGRLLLEPRTKKVSEVERDSKTCTYQSDDGEKVVSWVAEGSCQDLGYLKVDGSHTSKGCIGALKPE